MKYVVVIVRVLLGAWLVFNGVSYWLPGMPMGTAPVAVELMAALMHSHVMLLVKLVELVAGAMLVFGVSTPLALVVAFPVTLMVAWTCIVLEWPRERPLVGGAVQLAAHVFLLLAYLPAYKAMLKLSIRPLGDQRTSS